MQKSFLRGLFGSPPEEYSLLWEKEKGFTRDLRRQPKGARSLLTLNELKLANSAQLGDLEQATGPL